MAYRWYDGWLRSTEEISAIENEKIRGFITLVGAFLGYGFFDEKFNGHWGIAGALIGGGLAYLLAGLILILLGLALLITIIGWLLKL